MDEVNPLNGFYEIYGVGLKTIGIEQTSLSISNSMVVSDLNDPAVGKNERSRSFNNGNQYTKEAKTFQLVSQTDPKIVGSKKTKHNSYINITGGVIHGEKISPIEKAKSSVNFINNRAIVPSSLQSIDPASRSKGVSAHTTV